MPGIGHRIVVVGGAGLVGSAVARVLADDRGLDVVVCDTLGPGGALKWQGLPRRLDDLWRPADLMGRLEADWRAIDAVVVMADSLQPQPGDADSLFATAFHLPRQLFGFASARQKPLVWASTSHVYGSGPPVLARDPAALAALEPRTAFGRAHLAFDRFAARHWDGPDKPPVLAGLRLSSVYGRGEAHKGSGASLPVRALARVRAGLPVPIWRSTDPSMPDGGHARDWIHADDAGRMAADVVVGNHAGFFDIGTGSLTTARDVVRTAARVAGRQGQAQMVEPPADAAVQALPPADLSALAAAGIDTAARTLDQGLAGL